MSATCLPSMAPMAAMISGTRCHSSRGGSPPPEPLRACASARAVGTQASKPAVAAIVMMRRTEDRRSRNDIAGSSGGLVDEKRMHSRWAGGFAAGSEQGTGERISGASGASGDQGVRVVETFGRGAEPAAAQLDPATDYR